jgi:hypothetical protein
MPSPSTSPASGADANGCAATPARPPLSTRSLLGAALVGLLVVGWATAGGGAGKIGRLLDRVFDAITQRVT